jgi:hypothetical protein
MATFIDTPATNVFHQGVFGELSSASMNYLSGQLETMRSFGGEFAGLLYQKAANAFEAINGFGAVQAAKNILQQAESMFQADIIRPLFDLEALQNATPVMQNWIMVDPMIRQAWYDGKVEGYTDTYVDPEPAKVGEEMRAYRILMDGVLVPHTENGYQSVHFGERLYDEETALSIADLASIFTSQENARQLYEAGEFDPTSQYGTSL